MMAFSRSKGLPTRTIPNCRHDGGDGGGAYAGDLRHPFFHGHGLYHLPLPAKSPRRQL
jgi:hypothetical protein